ncbi:hypothetical protein [Frigoriglobus tundricola]|uniref:Uncharacterized protein n=1 Tax=Frigoriglobus tundricola TaxID=2774151 RepID=A0A6M5YMQ8_9BACT|nr:hypothetical protein [Frigoriglobus tundricola]QJW94630.1 hypothetical protein FTUN_2152 [Frigoriglobus tundricola]
MSAKIDQFCDRLRDGLDAVETRLQSVQANVVALPGKAEHVLQTELDAARRKVDGQIVRLEKAKDGVKAWAAAKVAETREAIGDWKAKRETQKLKARSDRAEAYAADALFFAAAAVDEAEAAILEAAVARLDADAAQPVRTA